MTKFFCPLIKKHKLITLTNTSPDVTGLVCYSMTINILNRAICWVYIILQEQIGGLYQMEGGKILSIACRACLPISLVSTHECESDIVELRPKQRIHLRHVSTNP